MVIHRHGVSRLNGLFPWVGPVASFVGACGGRGGAASAGTEGQPVNPFGLLGSITFLWALLFFITVGVVHGILQGGPEFRPDVHS